MTDDGVPLAAIMGPNGRRLRAALPVRTGPATVFVTLNVGGCDYRVECAVRRDDDMPTLWRDLIETTRRIAEDAGTEASWELIARSVAARLRGPFRRRITVSLSSAGDRGDRFGVMVATIE